MHISQQLSYQGLMTIVTWTLVQKKVHVCADRGMKIFIVKYVLIVLFFLLLAFEQIITSGSSRKKTCGIMQALVKKWYSRGYNSARDIHIECSKQFK